ncbi:hypothetical protein O4328_31455 [Rhodococcus opacus]|uniref:Uncharacterized protein n=1 Tax=Rhodococcus opacus TaxID=37919 RepID=A0ABT4NL94_RHOOP|nr:hypothetical protein [Rhodococcus opacus]MCZ4588149.1 hypothetical protein [Rhodococcus opacus]
MIERTTTSPSRTTGVGLAAPTARIAASGGLMMAVKWSIGYMPRLLMVKVPPVNSGAWIHRFGRGLKWVATAKRPVVVGE